MKPFSHLEDDILIKQRQLGIEWETIANHLGRSVDSCEARYRRINGVLSGTNPVLRSTHTREEKERLRERAEKEKLDKLYGGIYKTVQKLSIKTDKIKCQFRHDTKRINEVVVAQQTDVHAGTAETGELQDKVNKWVNTVVDITQGILASRYNLPELYIPMTGDMITGELIYPGQAFEIKETTLTQVITLTKMYEKAIGEFLKYFEKIHVDGVLGNHGRFSKYADHSTNADAFFYNMLKTTFADEPRVIVNYEPKDFKIIKRINGNDFFLFHGDQINMNGRVPHYGIESACQSWGNMYPNVKYFMGGHFHTIMRLAYNRLRAYMGGTYQERSNFSEGKIKRDPTLSQWMLCVNERMGVTNEWEIKLV